MYTWAARCDEGFHRHSQGISSWHIGPDTGHCSSAPRITFSFLRYHFPSHLVCTALVRPESHIHYYWTGLLETSQPTHDPIFGSLCVHCSDGFLPWLVSGLFLHVGFIVFILWLRKYFPSNFLASTTLTFLSNFCCCFLFQLRVFLRARLFSFILGSWLRVSYGPVILGFGLCFLRLLVVPPVPLFFVSFLFSAFNFPNVDQRPGFFVAFTWASGASWWLGKSCSAGNELFVVVASCVALPNIKNTLNCSCLNMVCCVKFG